MSKETEKAMGGDFSVCGSDLTWRGLQLVHSKSHTCKLRFRGSSGELEGEMIQRGD